MQTRSNTVKLIDSVLPSFVARTPNKWLDREHLILGRDAVVNLSPPGSQNLGSIPGILGIAQPESQKMSPRLVNTTVHRTGLTAGDLLLLRAVRESTSSVKDRQVIDILDIALLELGVDAELFSREV
jgi:hypothetical protein